MIPWFYAQEELAKFKDKRPPKREKLIREQLGYVEKQKLLLNEKADSISVAAKEVSRRARHGDKHRATEAMMSVAFELKNAEPLLSNYVNNLLLLRVYEMMHIDGYVDPNTLPEAMADIDYGLYSLSNEDELRHIVEQGTDPLAIIGINVE